jgi:HK97 gp10 family phage protein
MAVGRHKSIEITGVKETMSALRQLPGAAQRAVLRPAVTKAATPVLRLAKQLTPVGEGMTPDGRKRPHLNKTLKKTRAKVYKKTGAVLVVLGPEKNKSPHSHLVHDGTKSHDIKINKTVFLRNGVIIPAGTVVKHPGAKAQPFMDEAGIGARSQSQQILMDEIPKGIEKQAAKLAKKAAAKGGS